MSSPYLRTLEQALHYQRGGKGDSFAAVTVLSSQAFAFIQITKLPCAAPTVNGHPLVGVGYTLAVTTGLNAHAPNGQGGIGVAVGPEFALLSQVVSPTAPLNREKLELKYIDVKGNYHLEGKEVKAVVDADLDYAAVKFASGAKTTCK